VSDVALNSEMHITRIQYHDLYSDYQTCDLRQRLASLHMCAINNDCSPTRSNFATLQIHVNQYVNCCLSAVILSRHDFWRGARSAGAPSKLLVSVKSFILQVLHCTKISASLAAVKCTYFQRNGKEVVMSIPPKQVVLDLI
jgi:hypothetical protein